jgi:hypothetical protein
MALPDLSKMKDEDYKRLTSRDLLKHNLQMPEMDYENPYLHQEFPRVCYRVVLNDAGDRELESVDVPDKATYDEIMANPEDGWRNSVMDCGVVLHTEAPKLQTGRHTIPLPPVPTEVVAEPRKPVPQKVKVTPA